MMIFNEDSLLLKNPNPKQQQTHTCLYDGTFYDNIDIFHLNYTERNFWLSNKMLESGNDG